MVLVSSFLAATTFPNCNHPSLRCTPLNGHQIQTKFEVGTFLGQGFGCVPERLNAMSSYPVVVDRDRRLSWSAIFGGTFVFLAIEATFGILGMAIFASATTPANGNAVTGGISTGMGIWAVVLSIIALYFGGRAAAVLSRTSIPHIGMYHGFVTFGVAVFSSVLITSMVLTGTVSGTATPATMGSGRVADVLAVGGYWLFVALILGLIAATAGGRQGVEKTDVRAMDRSGVGETRRAA
jgi:hypothetical protein